MAAVDLVAVLAVALAPQAQRLQHHVHPELISVSEAVHERLLRVVDANGHPIELVRLDALVERGTREPGGVWVSGNFGMMPPSIGGGELEDRFDVVTHCHGLQDFGTELGAAAAIEVDGVPLKVLPLDRIIASKRATNREKDRIALPALETALAVIGDEKDDA